MKKLIFTFLLILFYSFSLHAQKKVYFDINWNVTSKEKALYYRIVANVKTKSQQTIDYYLSGKKAKEVWSKKGRNQDDFSIFYESGELMTTGKYENSLKEGVWKTYYKNGKIKQKGKYKDGEKVGVWKTFYKK